MVHINLGVFYCNGHHNGTYGTPGFSHLKLETAFLIYLNNIKPLEFNDKIIDKKEVDIDFEKTRITNEISKLNDKRTSTIKLFTEDKIDLETYKEIQSIIEKKITKLNEELKNINIESEEEFLEGYSALKNPELMRVFRDLDLVEHLGTGIKKILK